MSAVLASWNRYRTPVLIDIALLAALYLLWAYQRVFPGEPSGSRICCRWWRRWRT